MKRNTPLKRYSRIRVAGQSDEAELKREIQGVARDIVILRDEGCVLRGKRRCGGIPGVSGVVLQADHLITRSNSATYADTRLIVCVCKSCHAWKSLGGNLRKAQYDALVKTILSKERVELWEKCEADSWRPVPKRSYDWKLALLALNQELREMQQLDASDHGHIIDTDVQYS